MKSKILLAMGLLIAIVIGSTGCYKDVISPGTDPNGPPQFVSFSGDLIPLFSANCTTSGCHDDKPSHAPSLVPAKAYTSLISGGFVNTISPYQSVIYTEMKSGAMPPSGAIKSSEIQRVLDWIRNGAPNN